MAVSWIDFDIKSNIQFLFYIRINDSDHQDEIDTRCERSYSLSSKPPTPKVNLSIHLCLSFYFYFKVTIGHSLPKIPDWDPVIDEERENSMIKYM